MYRLITKDMNTMRWTEAKAVEADIIAQRLYSYIAVQASERRSAMLQHIASQYIADRKAADPGCKAEGELMTKLPVDVICAVLDDRLDESADEPLVLLASFSELCGPAYRLVWQADDCPHEQMAVDVAKEDGSGIEQRTFCLPAKGLGHAYVAEAITAYDRAFGTHLGRLAFRSLRIATAYSSFITVADLLNLEQDFRL